MCATHPRQTLYPPNHAYLQERGLNERELPPTVHPPHHPPPPYPFYPPTVCYSPYDPYAAYHHPIPFYTPPPPPSPPYYANDVTNGEEQSNTAGWSFFSILFLVLFFFSLIAILYRGLPYETRRRIAAWLPLPGLAPEVKSLGHSTTFHHLHRVCPPMMRWFDREVEPALSNRSL